MLTVRLPKEMEKDLAFLVEKTHRPKSYYVKKALGDFLAKQLEILGAVAAYEEYLQDGDKGVSWEEIQRQARLLKDD